MTLARLRCNAMGLPYGAVTLSCIPVFLYYLTVNGSGNRIIMHLFGWHFIGIWIPYTYDDVYIDGNYLYPFVNGSGMVDTWRSGGRSLWRWRKRWVINIKPLSICREQSIVIVTVTGS